MEIRERLAAAKSVEGMRTKMYWTDVGNLATLKTLYVVMDYCKSQ